MVLLALPQLDDGDITGYVLSPNICSEVSMSVHVPTWEDDHKISQVTFLLCWTETTDQSMFNKTC